MENRREMKRRLKKQEFPERENKMARSYRRNNIRTCPGLKDMGPQLKGLAEGRGQGSHCENDRQWYSTAT
jgi:hypothetical protein